MSKKKVLGTDFGFTKDEAHSLLDWIRTTREYEDITGRMLALQAVGRYEFIIDRGLYQVYAVASNELQNFVDLNVDLSVDIRIFDTVDILYVPASINNLYIKGTTRDYQFKNKLIGGLDVSNVYPFDAVETIHVQKGAFYDLMIKHLEGNVIYKDEDGKKLRISQLYENCTINKVRTLWYTETNGDDFERFTQNGNKILCLTNYDITMFMGEYFEDTEKLGKLVSQVYGIALRVRISIIGPRSIHDSWDDYLEDVKTVIQDILEFSSKDTNIEFNVVFNIPAYNFRLQTKDVYAKLSNYLEKESTVNCLFKVYV